MRRFRFLLGATLLSLAASEPLAAQRIQDWQYRWFWGARAGVTSFSLPSSGRTFVGMAGGEWLITARRVALHIGYDQTFAGGTDTFRLSTGGTEAVSFDGMRQIQIDVVAIIGDNNLQPYVGGGFVIASLTNARSTNPTSPASVNDAIATASSGGFMHLLAGAHYRMGRKMAIFGNFSYSAQGRDFLLAGNAMTFQGGIRYAFLSAKEGDLTTRR